MKETIKNNVKAFLSIYLTYLTYFFIIGELKGLDFPIYKALIFILLYSFIIYLVYSLIFNIIFKLKLSSLITCLLTIFSVIISFYFDNSEYINIYSLSICFICIFLLYGLIKSKKLNKNNIVKYIIILLVPIILLYLIVLVYSLIYERDKLMIDRYNFEQLGKVKNTLNNLKNLKYNFENLKDLNEKYNLSIKPIKNCYFTQSHNGSYLYIFGFKLESTIYRFIYFEKDYAYPKYDLLYEKICYGGPGNKAGCDYRNRSEFEYTISNPCQD